MSKKQIKKFNLTIMKLKSKQQSNKQIEKLISYNQAITQMTTRTQQIEDLFCQFKSCLEEMMTAEQKKYFEKLSAIYKDFAKNQKELGIEGDSKFYSSLQIQMYSLKKDVLNKKKPQMSDYEAFLWKDELYKTRKQLFVYIPKQALMDHITLPKRAIAFEQQPSIFTMKQLSFCPLGHSINNIIQFSLDILFQNSYCEKSFKRQTMSALLSHIAREYQIVSYHNFTHAFSVQLMLFQCYEKSPKLNTTLTPFEVFVSYVAALAHDIGHYGTNSDFQAKKKSDLAKLYNNDSVLENMHISKFSKLLRKFPQVDIVSQMKDPVERERTKRLLIRLILGTDVTKHFDNLAKMKSLQSRDLQQLEILEKQVIQENLFHACDIGNCCLEFGDFMNWAMLLSYEFNSQYEMEGILGLEQTAMFKYGGEKGFYKGQCGFVDVLAFPLWKSIGEVFEQLQAMVGNIEKNRKKLQEIVVGIEGQEKK